MGISYIQPCARDSFRLTESRAAWQTITESAFRNAGTKCLRRAEENLAHLIPPLLMSWNKQLLVTGGNSRSG